MFQPKFLIRLGKENFIPSKVVCLGSQLIAIIDFLKMALKPHFWCAADVDAFSPLPTKFSIDTFFLRKIGNDSAFIEISSEITQFLSGVFFAIDINFSEQKIDQLEVSTEDAQFRPVALNGVLIEIRTFDTSFFELYSENEEIMKNLAIRFGVELITNPLISKATSKPN